MHVYVNPLHACTSHPLATSIKHYLNNCLARLRNSFICVHLGLASPSFLGLKIIYIIVLHVYVTPLYAWI